MPEHGGNLRRIAAITGTNISEWLDLSTGINPYSWNVPEIPPNCWKRLPEQDDGLLEVASEYYGTTNLLPVSGSQNAIQHLPRLFSPGRVGIISPTYAEHAYSWGKAGHAVTSFSIEDVGREITKLMVLVIVNPNNPTGYFVPREQIQTWLATLKNHNGYLIIDEAFMDTTPQSSLVTETHKGGLIVLRSFGKFFGLAGIRIGFVSAESQLLASLNELIGPWPVNGAARWIARQALSNVKWHQQTRIHLRQMSRNLEEILATSGLNPAGGTPFFQWVRTRHADAIYQQLLNHKILVRRFDNPKSLRFGLPGSNHQWHRLEIALARISYRVS